MATGNVYLEGEPIKLSVTFKVDGVLTDPTTVTLKIKYPSGTEEYTYADGDITKDATGTYSKTITAPGVDAKATAWYRFVGTGTAAGRKQAYFTIVPSEVD